MTNSYAMSKCICPTTQINTRVAFMVYLKRQRNNFKSTTCIALVTISWTILDLCN